MHCSSGTHHQLPQDAAVLLPVADVLRRLVEGEVLQDQAGLVKPGMGGLGGPLRETARARYGFPDIPLKRLSKGREAPNWREKNAEEPEPRDEVEPLGL